MSVKSKHRLSRRDPPLDGLVLYFTILVIQGHQHTIDDLGTSMIVTD